METSGLNFMLNKLIKKNYKVILVFIVFVAILVRFYKLGNLTTPYWEEVALGYDAFSILKTGRDHHGNFLPIVAFESFGDWKASLYFYAIIPFIKLFGLNVWAVRMPAAIAGVLTVIGTGKLAYLLKKSKKFQLLVMILTAINPWAVHFSRAAWEVNLATSLLVWGIYFGWKYVQDKKSALKNLFMSAILLILAMYTYHAMRMIAPLMGLSIFVSKLSNTKNLKNFVQTNWQKLGLMLALVLLLIAPILLKMTDKKINQRFAETSMFSQIEIIQESNALREQAGNTIMARLIYHRYWFYAREILQNMLSHFNLDFLFISGDVNPRHSIQAFGHFYHFEVVFLLLGMFALFKKKAQKKWLLGSWIFITLIPVSLTKTTPHALRILPMMPAMILILGFGLVEFVKLFKFKKILSLLLVAAYLFEIAWYAHDYLYVYPQQYSREWQAGYKEIVADINQQRQANPDKIIYVSREKGRPAMYYWFYSQTDPKKIQAANETAAKDQGEFLEFENLRFGDEPH